MIKLSNMSDGALLNLRMRIGDEVRKRKLFNGDPKARRNLRWQFQIHRCGAKRSGTGFELTFEQWLSIWKKSGKLHLRGRGRGRYVMGRNNDSGPYAVGNVKIITHRQNIREYHARRR